MQQLEGRINNETLGEKISVKVKEVLEGGGVGRGDLIKCPISGKGLVNEPGLHFSD